MPSIPRRFTAALITALCSCNVQYGTPSAALFELPTDPAADLFSLPFPNDLRRGADGRIDFASLATGHVSLIQGYMDLAASGRFGFSANGPIFFRFSSPIDVASLPRSPRDSLDRSASAYLVDVDPRSPERGARVPLRYRFSDAAGKHIGPNALAMMPVGGFGLRPGTTYAAVISEGLLDQRGRSVVAQPGFMALLADEAPLGLEREHAAYAPLRAFLKDSAITDVVAAAVFTTGDNVSLMPKLRAAVYRTPAPQPHDLVLADRTSRYWEIRGTYEAPNFQSGTVPFATAADGGDIELDDGGSPRVAFTETLRFALTVPRGKMPPNGWPVVLYAHGTGGDYRSFIRSGVASTLARVVEDDSELGRFAVVGIDQSLHGARVPEGNDPESLFVNIYNPIAALNNLLQGACDNFSLLRMIESLRFRYLQKPDRWPVDFGNEVKLDTRRVAFLGHSQGALTGTVFLPYEPGVQAAVLSGGGGVGILSLLNRGQPDFSQILSLLVHEELDEFHPLLAVVQQLLDASDPANHAPLLLRYPPAEHGAKHLLLFQGIVDHYTPGPASVALSVAAGVPVVGPQLDDAEALSLRSGPPRELPVAGNVSAHGQSVTAGLVQHAAPLDGEKPCTADRDCGSGRYCDHLCYRDGHFVIFDRADAQRQYALFLATFFRDGLPTIVAP